MGKKPRVVVFFGGEAANRDLSWETGVRACEYLPRSDYDVAPVHITPDGAWQVPLGTLPRQGHVDRMIHGLFKAVPATPPRLGLERLLQNEVDVLFPLLRGRGGDDGAMAQLGATLGVATVGPRAQTCMTTYNKQLCAKALGHIALSPMAYAAATLPPDAAYPLFVKPAVGEGSVGTRRVEELEELAPALAFAGNEAFIQEAATGTEVTFTVYKDDAGVHVLPPTVVAPTRAKFFDSLAKRRSGRVNLKTVDSTESKSIQKAQQIARDVYEELQCEGAVAIDMVVGGSGIEVLEVNAVPTMTAHTPLLQQLKAVGRHPTKWLSGLVKAALR